jgi:hypothetical protein
MGPTQPYIQSVLRFVPGCKRSGHNVDQSLSSGAEVQPQIHTDLSLFAVKTDSFIYLYALTVTAWISINGNISTALEIASILTRFKMCTAAIQQRVTAVLRSIPKEAFADSF